MALASFELELSRFDLLMGYLQRWWDIDQEDSIALSRSDIIEIIEGVRFLRGKVEDI
jgi:hypothetical protein